MDSGIIFIILKKSPPKKFLIIENIEGDITLPLNWEPNCQYIKKTDAIITIKAIKTWTLFNLFLSLCFSSMISNNKNKKKIIEIMNEYIFPEPIINNTILIGIRFLYLSLYKIQKIIINKIEIA